MGRLVVVGLALVGWALVREAGADGEGTVTGTVRDAAGAGIVGVEVVLEIGRAHYQLGSEYDRWDSVRTERTTSGSDGGFRFTDVPAGAGAVVWAKTPTGFASAPAVPSAPSASSVSSVSLRLGALGSVTGKLAAKP